MTEEQIKHMVNRFLGWKLPENFNPDAGISYARPNYAPEVDATPSGTNLFDATQADAMVRYMLEGMSTDLERAIAVIADLFGGGRPRVKESAEELAEWAEEFTDRYYQDQEQKTKTA